MATATYRVVLIKKVRNGVLLLDCNAANGPVRMAAIIAPCLFMTGLRGN